ncbi:Lrp/AsnC family transcriptional regulator [Streptomyces stramineus]|uniref:HTH asnC-type domain-containing protein n=1 Tax=Streptomyces stramineus TaxID=173861 RepID=A0ABN0ZGW5_9ACTN
MLKEPDVTDRLDRRVIAALQVNPRASIGEIGRILGEHERTVARRLHRLLTEKIVVPTAIYDALRCSMGVSTHVRIQAERGTQTEVAAFLSNRQDVRLVMAIGGQSDVLWAEMITSRDTGLYALMTKDLPHVPHIDSFSAYLTIRTFMTVAEWHAPLLTEQEVCRLRSSAIKPLPDPQDHYELCPSDRRVAEALIRNSRITLTDLAKELDFSVATAGRRVTSLLERRMLHLRTEVEPACLGRPNEVQLGLRVRAEGLEEVGRALARCPEVRYCAAVTGRQNLLVELCLEHESDLYRFLVERLGTMPHIMDVETEIIAHAYKRGSVIKDPALPSPVADIGGGA